ITLLRIALEDGHQLDDRDAELLQIRNFFHETRIRTSVGWIHARIRVSCETLHMQFVNDCIRFVVWRPVARPVKLWPVSSQHAQGRASRVGSFPHCQLPVESGRKKNTFRVGVEQDLLRFKALPAGDTLSRDRISVVTTLTKFAEWYPAMPYPA